MSIKEKNSIKTLVANAIIMGLYIVLSLILPFSSGAIQFRLSESLNHLVVFNRKLLWGVFGGVIIYNLLFGFGPLDVVFGGGQTLLALLLTASLQNIIPSVKKTSLEYCLFHFQHVFNRHHVKPNRRFTVLANLCDDRA